MCRRSESLDLALISQLAKLCARNYNGTMTEPSDRERIEDLEAAEHVQDVRLDHLEAAGLVFDEQVVALAKEIDGLSGKMQYRAVIEQAKGVIMSTVGCGQEAAFAVLVAHSQAQNRKVRDIAAEIASGSENQSESD